MTPIGSRLQLKLDDEVRRMANEWFFKWHHIGRDGPVEIDSFRGKAMAFGGIKFDGSARVIYWDTIQHYLRKTISSEFDDLETEIKEYPAGVRRQAITEAQDLIRKFAARIRRMAIEKDLILRGDGVNFPSECDSGSWEGAKPHDIESRANGLIRIYAEDQRGRSVLWQRANMVWDQHRWWLGTLGLLVGVAGFLALFF